MTMLNATILGGISGTILMSLTASLVGMAGGPKMNAALLLAYVLDAPPLVGWIPHFAIGISLALIYSFLIMPRLTRISSPLAKGVVFGVISFSHGADCASNDGCGIRSYAADGREHGRHGGGIHDRTLDFRNCRRTRG